MKELLNTMREALVGLEEGLRHKAGSGTAAKGGAKGARSRKAAKRGGGGRAATGRPGAALSQKAAKKTAAKAVKKTAKKAAAKAAKKAAKKIVAAKATKKATKATKKATKKGAKRPLPLPRNASASLSQAPRRGFMMVRGAKKGGKQLRNEQRAALNNARAQVAVTRSDQFSNPTRARTAFLQKGGTIPVLMNKVQFSTGKRSFATRTDRSARLYILPSSVQDAQRLMRAGYLLAGSRVLSSPERAGFRQLYTPAQQKRFSK